MRPKIVWTLCALGLGALWFGCSASVDEPAASPAKPRSSEPVIPPGSLARREVVRVVDAGVGSFLQKASVEGSLKDGRFEGFRIVSLQPENFWRNVDLVPGDIVTAVNGKSIEDPYDAYAAMESLRTAPALRVQLLRNGTPRELVFPIVGAPQPKAEAANSGSSAPAPSSSEPEASGVLAATGSPAAGSPPKNNSSKGSSSKGSSSKSGSGSSGSGSSSSPSK